MKSYYVMIEKESFKFTQKHHFTPNVVYMNEDVYNYLLAEMIGDEWWILIHCQRILGMKIILSNNEQEFHLE